MGCGGDCGEAGVLRLDSLTPRSEAGSGLGIRDYQRSRLLYLDVSQ